MTETRFSSPPTVPAEVHAQGYYGVPVIHRPHWKWLITGYFFLGGISGASAVIAAIGRLYGGAHTESMVRIGTYVSFFALASCPPL
ncbi:MAG TPA: hypothetical protein VK356_04640, partial [Thermomicrobiales bacterium]|nr:hypothetical protein [Thermomicrobiales bacterium]